MKNTVLVFVLLFGLSATAQTESSKKIVIPAEVEAAFQKAYPKAIVTWNTDYKGQDVDKVRYEGKFTDKGSNKLAVYDNLGHLKAIETAIKPTQLPQKALDYLKVNYPKNPVSEASKVKTDRNVITYEAGLTRDGNFYDLQFDADGDFLQILEE